ncbi:MAG: dihydroorotate dehydrogenase electron transfer subunit [Planctomycetaceae bacterium]
MGEGEQTICYADNILIKQTPIERVIEVAQDTFLIRLEAPEIAASAVPGQFVMTRFSGRDAPLIGRALAVYDVVDDANGSPRAIDLVFVRKGAFTTPLATAAPGTLMSVWGPLGNGFSNRPCDVLVLAAGGIGQTPMLMLAREALGARRYGGDRQNGWAKRVRLVYGARTSRLLACVEDFQAAGIDVELCTDDGSRGTHARVPDRLFELLDQNTDASQTRVVTCGPEIMMEKVAQGCIARGIDCQVSMETPMACGIGICFSCVAKIRPGVDQAWDYRRTCVEGPVFDAVQLSW